MLALLAQIVVGFAMATLGVALLCLGEVPFIAGKRISAWRARLIGVVLLSFLPLAFGARQAGIFWFGPEAMEGPALTWSLCGFCWFVVLVLLFRVMVPKRASRKAVAAKDNPFGGAAAVDEEVILELVEGVEPLTAKTPPAKKAAAESAPRPVAKKTRKPASDECDPFDFS